MNGQYSIFDNLGMGRPCDYDFQRYIGQRVHICVTSGHYIGVVTEIGAYYTTIAVEELDCFLSDQVIILYGYDNKKDKSGGGGPAESIDEAVERLQRIITKEAQHEQRERELGHRRTA